MWRAVAQLTIAASRMAKQYANFPPLLVTTTNSVPIYLAKTTVTTNANNTTASVPIFRVTGTVEFKMLYGVVTTALSSNQTAAFWRVNDQTAQVSVSLNTGTTVSSLPVGSLLLRRSLVSVALAATSSAAGAVTDPVAATAPDCFMPFIVTQKTAAVQTDIEYTYTTTNAPATGAIQFFAYYIPLSEGSGVVAL